MSCVTRQTCDIHAPDCVCRSTPYVCVVELPREERFKGLPELRAHHLSSKAPIWPQYFDQDYTS